MYIWNVRKLKADLANPGLTAGQELAYLIPSLGLLACTFVSVPQHNFWSAVFGALVVLILAVGSVHAYRCNGGADGEDFASRYLSLAWVCGVRLVAFLVLPVTITMVIVPGSPWQMAWPGELVPLELFDVAVRLVFVPPLFWMVGRHLRDLAALPKRRSSERAAIDDAPGLEPLED